jgi:hypothetical protein
VRQQVLSLHESLSPAMQAPTASTRIVIARNAGSYSFLFTTIVTGVVEAAHCTRASLICTARFGSR